MHKSSRRIVTIWGKRNWWSIWEIARRRWSIGSCRHIFALRQRVKKNHGVFFSSWYALLPTLFFVRVCASIVWLVWCSLCEDIATIIYLFFFFSLALFYRLLRFFLFIANIIAARRWCMVNVYSYVYIYIYESMCSFCATVCRSGIYVIYSSEEIMLLCVQSNNISSLSLIIRYAQRV
jgi:hypothetical protein